MIKKCGYDKESLGLGVRSWICPKCHTIHDRDVNTAINIRTAGATEVAFGKTNTS
jgi:putative transposase